MIDSMSPIKKIRFGFTFVIVVLIFSACGPSPPPDLFHLIPPDFIGASYFDLKYIRENPDLNFPDQTGQNFCEALASPMTVDEVLGVVLPATLSEDSGIQISAVTICRGNFDQKMIMEQIDYPATSTQKYKGFELSTFDTGSEHPMTSAFLDESTWVMGMNEAGVKAVLDMAKSFKPSPYADLDAALTDAFFAMIFSHCNYEACDIRVPASLEKGSERPVSTVQLYQFESAEMAAAALPAITEMQEAGEASNIVGSVEIIGDTVTQEGRLIKIHGTLPVEDLPGLFE
jgi:hypothetical protein